MKRIVVFCTALISPTLIAHPHEWINLIVEPHTNAAHQITMLREKWQFDPVFAEVLLQPVLAAPDNATQAKLMAAIEHDINEKLSSQQHFTFANNLFHTATNRKLFVEAGILYYSFDLPLKKPTTKLAYTIYEPSYYIEMRYDPDKQKTRFANGCRLTITESTPDPALVAAAYAIDKTATGPADLGKYFAQQSEIVCQP